MKLSQLLLAVAFLMAPFFMNAQAQLGTWTWETTGPNGEKMNMQVTFKADNTFAVDAGVDGTIDIQGTFSLAGDRMTIKDNGGNCDGKPGVYDMVVKGDTVNITMVSEECEDRKGGSQPGDTFSMTKVK